MFLPTGNFERGLGGWRAVNLADAVAVQTVDDRARAKQGTVFMRFQTTEPSGSMAHDTQVPTAILSERAGILRVSYALSFSVWLKAEATEPLSGAIAIWDLTANEVSDTLFTVDQSWTQFTVGMDKPAYNVRVEIYLSTPNKWLAVDGAVLV
jgi:hypothetical protein